MSNITNLKKTITICFIISFSSIPAQTIINGFFPKKNDFTLASSYSYKSYDNFFRGTTATDANPAGMGEISSSVVSVYGEYGMLDWLSTTVTLPYISMRNETGVLDPVSQTDEVSGVQDLSVFLKAKVLEKNVRNSSKIAIGGAAGVSVPVGGYEEAGILSLGSGATTFDGCGFIQINASSNLFIELQAAYSLRTNSDFEIPNATLFSAKLGYYNKWFYAHAKVGSQNSLDGLDIGTPEFGAAGGAAALPETEVDYTNFYFDLYVPIYKQSIGISSGYTANMSGRNYDRASGFSVGLVYKAN
ncbi:transporter [Aquimarina sp. M1]